MAVADVAPARGLGIDEGASALAAQLRRLTRVATAVALVTSVPLIVWLDRHSGWPLWAAILDGLGAAIGPARTVKPGGVTGSEAKGIDAATVPVTFVLSQAQQLPDQSLALLLTPEPLPSL